MKTFKSIIAVVAGVILIALAGGLIYVNNLKTRAVPDYNRDVDLENLTAEVTVFRDSLGIPHIYAQNEPDLYRTVGYVMAQDRLWQMDLFRRVTAGRLSEVLDPGLVDVDHLFRALQIPLKSRLVLERTDPAIVACLEAFSDGVNQYIEQNRKKLPFEFALLGYSPDPWEPIHSVNLIGYMSWDLASGWNTEMDLYRLQQVLDSAHFTELLPDLDVYETPVFPDYMVNDKTLQLQSHLDDAAGIVEKLGLQVFQASNNWAVSGTRSKTGMPVMANDMHLGLMAPGIWYQMHLVVEGGLDVTGVALPGAPYVIAGHNKDIAWGMTNVTVDDTDFYLETINPADSNQYLLDGQWRDMEIVEESIPVKGRDEPEIRVNRYTHRGPVVSKFKGVEDRVISVRWQGRDYSNEVRSVHLLDRASNWDEFRDAVSTFNSISQNIVYADRFGNIGLQTSAGVPIRKGGGIMVYPGDTSLYDWQGTVPFEELPFAFNPQCGYVSSANNKTVGADYPYYIGTWFSLPSRIERIRDMLDSREEHGIEDFERMQRDQTSRLASEFTPVYIDALEGQTEGIYHSAFEELKDWDYNMGPGSSAALIYEFIWIELHRVLFMDELGTEHYSLLPMNSSITQNLISRIRVRGSSAWCDDITTPGVTETFQDNIRAAFQAAVDTITTLFGVDPGAWHWGDLHQLSLNHPLGSVKMLDKAFRLNRGPYPVGGSFHTVCPYSYPVGSSFIADHGASERHIFSTADWDKSLTVIPTGNSGVPASAHYMDQTELYVNNQYHRDLFTRELVEANMKYRATFR
jgi:penicillin amidase